MRHVPRHTFVGALTLAGLALFATPRSVRAADEGEEGAKSIEEKLKAQMEKVLRLMRENQKALLEAARGTGKQPGPVDVPIPDGAGGMGGQGGDGGMVGGRPPEGGTPPPGGRGDEIRKRMEEILKTTEQSGGAIPKELEELVRMIPRQSGSGQGGPPPPPGSPRKPGEGPKPEDDKDKEGEKKDPQDGSKDDKKPEDQRGNDKPPEGETGPKRNDEAPPWLLELPEEQRRIITGGSIEKVPERYRALVERYQKWLAEKVKERKPR